LLALQEAIPPENVLTLKPKLHYFDLLWTCCPAGMV